MSTEVEHPETQSWRGISQSVSARAMSAPGRRRMSMNIVRGTFTVVALAGLAALGVYLVQGFQRPAETLAPVVKAEPLREVVVLTDGVLNEAWAREALALPDGIALIAVDLDAARAALLRTGQVKSVVVAREFPDTLVVTMEERVPVIRIMAAIEPGKLEPLVVSRDGVVYRPINNNPIMLQSLPWLDGVRLTRQGEGFAPLAGIDDVSDLLLAVQQEAPHLATEWRVVSMEELPRLVVRTRAIKQIVFDTINVRRQLAWLDHILDQEGRRAEPRAIERIDLSIAARAQPPAVPQVVVKYVLTDITRPRGSSRTPAASSAGARLVRTQSGARSTQRAKPTRTGL
ncbi:MAG: FtsQ-type POTRA domain-containing protein [Opitutaceae bacterium]|nr:FtsQ-type POTRA domain-containing protein [Opitutaceae bacterium]